MRKRRKDCLRVVLVDYMAPLHFNITPEMLKQVWHSFSEVTEDC